MAKLPGGTAVDRETSAEMKELQRLTSAIRTELASLKQGILSEEEEAEENKIFNDFDQTVLVQVFSTLDHLVNYQGYGWRELVDGGDADGEKANSD